MTTKRHGTTTLFPALNILDGTVIGRNMLNHRHQGFIRLANGWRGIPAGRSTSPDLSILTQRGRRLLRQAHALAPQRGAFRSVIDLQVAINRLVAETNLNPKPLVWTADPKRVLAAVEGGRQTLESVH
jgi:hypothetical protein